MNRGPDQFVYDPSVGFVQPNTNFNNGSFINQPGQMHSGMPQKQIGPSSKSRIPSLHLPAIILLGFSWLLHTLGTFIPYWATYSDIIGGARAGLWSARYFDYMSIQNFYFPEPTDFQTITNSIRFTGSHTKGYLVTVQFLMTFNFVVMLIVLVLLVADYIFAHQSTARPRSFLIRDYNSTDTVLKYALLLYIIYVFGVFEFAAWITFVGSRHDNTWKMHVSFAFAVIVSAFLVIIFIMYVIEFIKRFKQSRVKWEYWYGPYIEWGFFVYLSALLLLLTVICCPEWAYFKVELINVFAEIGLFKQCYFTSIYKKTTSSYICTLSHTPGNQAWVNATQAFMLMAYIIGMIILVIIVVFRKEFRHNAQGYHSSRVPQPTFTFIIAGLILFFCFIFTLIGIAIFGGKVFPNGAKVNWAYIVAVFSMVLFLIAGILFILDAVHSRKQMDIKNTSGIRKFIFPPPLNQRVLAMQPLIKPEPAWKPKSGIPPVVPQSLPTWNTQRQDMYPTPNFYNPSFAVPQHITITPINYATEHYMPGPYTQAAIAEYYQRLQDESQLLALLNNQGLTSYVGSDPLFYSDNRNNTYNDNSYHDMARQHFVQQQRLNYNHERLLQRYSNLGAPRSSGNRTYGSSALPGRNYDDYLNSGFGDRRNDNSLVAWSRSGIGQSDDTYRWMGGDSYGPLARDVNSVMYYGRNEPMPYVYAEKSEPIRIYNRPIFGLIPAYLRSIYKTGKYSKKNNDKHENKIELNDFNNEKNITNIVDDNNDISDDVPAGYISSENSKVKHDDLVPNNILLFNINAQQSNGSIQSYGQSLYLTSSYHNQHNGKDHHNNMSFPSPLDTDSAVADLSNITTSSLNHKYHKMHLKTNPATMSLQPLKSLSKGLSSSTSPDQPDTLKTSSISQQFEPISTIGGSLVHYETPFNLNNNPPTMLSSLGSTTTSSNQNAAVSFDNASPLLAAGDIISSSSKSNDIKKGKASRRFVGANENLNLSFSID